MDADGRRRLRLLIGTARTVLDDLDPDEVPARLRTVAKSSARRLPPPFEKSLLDAIARDQAFRSAVAAAWADGETSDEFVEAFLENPDGVGTMLEEVRAHSDRRRVEDDLANAEAKIAALEGELAEAKTRLADERRVASQEQRSVRAEVKRSRDGIERALRKARSEADEARDRADRAEERADQLQSQLDEQRIRMERAARRASRRQDGAGGATRPAPMPTADPAKIAVWIDTAERVLRPYRRRAAGTSSGSAANMPALPAGMAPDRPESVAALGDLALDRTILDGYNVASAMGIPEFGSHHGRTEAIRIAHMVARLVSGDVVVVFDAAGVEGRTSFTTDLGIEVRFSHDRTADDVIVSLVETGLRTAVITNDRELRERASAQGAVTLWSDAVTEWANA